MGRAGDATGAGWAGAAAAIITSGRASNFISEIILLSCSLKSAERRATSQL